MWTHRIAYRHQNGEVEGFKGISLVSEEAAINHAHSLIRAKLRLLNQPFSSARLITNERHLTPEERHTVRQDWKVGS